MISFYLINNGKVTKKYKGINTANKGFKHLICRYPFAVIRLYDTELKEIIKQYYPIGLLK